MCAAKTVIVLGGGVGGVVAASELRKRLPRSHRVVLVDREREHVFAPSLLWLIVGLREAKSIKRRLERLERKGIEVLLGEVEKIDPAALRVTVAGEELEADYLIVSLGAELAPEIVPGLEKAGHGFYTLSDAEGLQATLELFTQGRIVVLTATPAYKCPAAPYEAALLIDASCRKRGLREVVTIDFYAAEPEPMGVAGHDTSAAVRQLLQERNIPYHPKHQVTSVDTKAKRLDFANGAQAEFDLLIYVPPHRPPRVIGESGLAGDTGWIPVDRHSMETRFPHVYAIGDVVSIPLKLGKPLPKAGVFAHRQAEIVAHNIVGTLTGRPTTERFDGHGECFLEIGGRKAAFAAGDFYAEPKPVVELHPPGRRWHWGKVLLEKSWLHRKF
jgi:sulfide:quinone oxidoreductase